jgi:hypothetical protein
VQEYNRKFAPHPWHVQRESVAGDCQWAWRGLVVAFPGWKMFGRLFGGVFSDTHVMGKVEVVGHQRLQRGLANSQQDGGGLRGTCYGFQAGDSFIGGPGISVYEPHVTGFPTSAGTVLMHYRKLDSTKRTSSAFGHHSNVVASYLFTDLPNASDQVRFTVGNGTGSPSGLTTTGLTYGDDVWAFTWGSRGMELWQNGILRNSNGLTPTRPSQSDHWGLGGTLGVFGADNAECGCCLLYNRQLEVPEILELTIDPWTPVRPARYSVGRSITTAALRRARIPGIIG